MQQLRDALRNQVNAPQEATYQQQVSTALQQLAAARGHAFPPTWEQALEELGIQGLLGQQLAVRDIFECNQITPSVALDLVRVSPLRRSRRSRDRAGHLLRVRGRRPARSPEAAKHVVLDACARPGLVRVKRVSVLEADRLPDRAGWAVHTGSAIHSVLVEGSLS